MRRTTFINKTPESSNVSRLTAEERRRINERNREHRHPHRALVSSSTQQQSGSRSSFAQARSDGGQGPVSNEDNIEGQLALAQALSSGRLQVTDAPLIRRSAPDPFDAVSVPLNSQVIRLLRYYKDAYYICLWGNIEYVTGPRFKDRTIQRCTPERVIYECMHARSRMYALLASIACHLQHEVQDHTGINGLALIQRGTIALQEDLRNDSRVTPQFLVCAIHLYLAAKSYQQLEAARAHLAGAKGMLRELIRQKTPLRAPTAGLAALIDVDLAYQLLDDMSPEQEEPGARTSRPTPTFEEMQAMSPSLRP